MTHEQIIEYLKQNTTIYDLWPEEVRRVADGIERKYFLLHERGRFRRLRDDPDETLEETGYWSSVYRLSPDYQSPKKAGKWVEIAAARAVELEASERAVDILRSACSNQEGLSISEQSPEPEDMALWAVAKIERIEKALKSGLSRYCPGCAGAIIRKRELEEKIKRLVKALTRIEAYNWNDGCGCCSNQSLDETDEWKAVSEALKAWEGEFE